jgi:hypothetical protein
MGSPVRVVWVTMSRLTERRRHAAWAVELLAAGALGGAPAAGATEPAPVPQLSWRDCDDGLECATAKVPLDHDRPHGRQIELALIRFPATDREHRIGSLLIHPGGSGGAGDVLTSFNPCVLAAMLGYLEERQLPRAGRRLPARAPVLPLT